MIDAVVFDLDGTLCEYRRSSADLLDRAFAEVGVEPFITAAEYYGRFSEFAERGASTEAIRERCFASLATEAGRDPETGRAVARAYAAERDHRNVRFRPGAADALSALADEPLALVTNGGPDMQRPKLDALGIADAFEEVVFAGYDIPAKPDPAPFERVLDSLSVSPDRAVHVGNSLESDVAGAAAAGLRSAWVPRDGADPGGHEPDYVLDSPADLADPPWA